MESTPLIGPNTDPQIDELKLHQNMPGDRTTVAVSIVTITAGRTATLVGIAELRNDLRAASPHSRPRSYVE